MKKFSVLLGAALVALLAMPATAQTAGRWSASSTVISAVGGTTTGTYPSTPTTGIDTSTWTSVLIHVVSASTSTASIVFDQSINGSKWFDSVTVTDPTAAGELWMCPAARYARFRIATHGAGTISAYVTGRYMESDPVATGCHRINTWTGFTFASGTGTFSVASGKTAAVSNSLTLAGTDSTTMTFPSTSASVARIDAAQTFAGAQTFSGSMQRYATAKALSAGSATIFATVTVASNGRTGGYLTYTIDADDGTEFQARSGVLPFSAVNKAGTITCTVGTVGTATEVVAVSSGTLTNTFTCADAGGNVMNLLANAASSLTETTLEIRPFVTTNNAATVTYP